MKRIGIHKPSSPCRTSHGHQQEDKQHCPGRSQVKPVEMTHTLTASSWPRERNMPSLEATAFHLFHFHISALSLFGLTPFPKCMGKDHTDLLWGSVRPWPRIKCSPILRPWQTLVKEWRVNSWISRDFHFHRPHYQTHGQSCDTQIQQIFIECLWNKGHGARLWGTVGSNIIAAFQQVLWPWSPLLSC